MIDYQLHYNCPHGLVTGNRENFPKRKEKEKKEGFHDILHHLILSTGKNFAKLPQNLLIVLPLLNNTVPFLLIWLSCTTAPVVLARFCHLSHITTPMADDLWWIQEMVKKGV